MGLFGGAARYCAVMPPSKVRMVPVAKRLSSLARNRIPAAISSGVPSRPRSWRAASALRVAARSALVLRISLKYGVSILPGAIGGAIADADGGHDRGAAAAAPHRGNRVFAAQEHAADIDRHQCVPVL